MKKRVMLIFGYLIASAISIGAQSQLFKGSNVLLPADFIISYAVNLYDQPYILEGYKNNFGNIEFKGEDPAFDIANYFIQKVFSGEKDAYYINDGSLYYPYDILERRGKLPLDEVKMKLTSEYGIIPNPFNNGVPYDVKSFEFIEKWNFNQEDFSFSKNIIAFNPIRVSLEPEKGIVKRRTFYIFNDSAISLNTKKHVNPLLKIGYEFFIDKMYCDSLPRTFVDGSHPFREGYQMWNENTRNSLIVTLLTGVLDGKKQAIDYYTKQQLSIQEIKDKIGMSSDTTEIMNMDGSIETTVINRDFNPYDFKSILFLEEWYLTDDGDIEKKVIGVSPVYYKTLDAENGIEYKKKMTFWIYL